MWNATNDWYEEKDIKKELFKETDKCIYQRVLSCFYCPSAMKSHMQQLKDLHCYGNKDLH